jgi:hypothetical protein
LPLASSGGRKKRNRKKNYIRKLGLALACTEWNGFVPNGGAESVNPTGVFKGRMQSRGDGFERTRGT